MKRPLVIPESLHRNAPDVHALGPENTGATLMGLVSECLGLSDLGGVDVLDIGCGVRFTQAIVNRNIPVRSYTGIDVHEPLIAYLRENVDDPSFTFAHWDVRNAKYNPTGIAMEPGSALPVAGSFDIIWLFSVFTHLDPADANALLAILRRYVRPGGTLFFSAFLDDSVGTFEARIPDRPLDHPCYSEAFMRALVSANGWAVASVNPPSPEHCIQHYLICQPVIPTPEPS